ncbi:MAG: hypothetical protein IDH49_08095 [Gammaproteobacteria bacterium]|nr:hypothetical protein [Gammaproteobacteria bacterium]
MEKETIKNFIHWLESATEEEIMSRIEEVRAAHKKISSREARADLNLALRLIDEELLTRMDLRRRELSR